MFLSALCQSSFPPFWSLFWWKIKIVIFVFSILTRWSPLPPSWRVQVEKKHSEIVIRSLRAIKIAYKYTEFDLQVYEYNIIVRKNWGVGWWGPGNPYLVRIEKTMRNIGRSLKSEEENTKSTYPCNKHSTKSNINTEVWFIYVHVTQVHLKMEEIRKRQILAFCWNSNKSSIFCIFNFFILCEF